MIPNQKLNYLYQIALQRDISNTVEAFQYAFESKELLSDEEFRLIELLTDMYTDVPSVAHEITYLIRSILQYDITNINELIQILTPYCEYIEVQKVLNQPVSFQIRHDLITQGLPEEFARSGGRLCTLRLFLVQASSNVTLTNDHKNFCIHSNVFDDIKQNNFHGSPDLLDTIVIDLSTCETATVGYLCQHWLYDEMKKGRIIPPPALKEHVEDICGK